ncbi:PilN family type IVB pilus formation outer membrane protein [Salmonella enterica]|nr:PilN family type IVB pilus formation outer membrane protein [Salmonella enterica]
MRLVLCEKPSQGRDIAKFLGATQRGDGFLSGPGVTVTWARGHLLETAEPEVYGEQYGKPWRTEVLPLLPQQWKLVVKADAKAQFAVINRLLKQVDEVVIATDADREGEVIARELLDSSSSQQTTVDQSRNVYDDMKKTLETMLTPQKGRFWLSASTGTLTVTDTPSVLNSIAAYVEQQNRQMNRQVRLNVQVLSVSTSRKEQLGLDWNIVYKSLRSAGASLNNVSGDIANATSASVSILDTATGNAAKFAGSSLLIKALSEQGDVSVVTSQGSVTTNLTPVPIQMADQTVYVAQSSTTTTTDVGATTSLTPGMMTTGFNMTLLPLIQDDGDVQLQVAFNLSDPPTIRNFTSKDGNSYIEMPYTKLRSLSQKTNLRAGQALVLTGFDQSNTRMTKNGTFTPGNFLLGGGRDGDDSRSTLVIIITPELMGNGG